MARFWLLALRNLQRNLKRNFATGSAIAFGFAGIVILGAYANRASQYLAVHTIFAGHTGHLAIYRTGGVENFDYKPKKFAMTLEQQRQIEGILRGDRDVDFFERQLWGSGLIGNGCAALPFFARGLEPDVDRRVYERDEVREWLADFKPIIKGRALWGYPVELAPVALSLRLALGLGKTAVHDEVTAASPATAVAAALDCSSATARARFAADANVQMVGERWDGGGLGAIDGEVVAHFTTGFDEGDNSALTMPLGDLQKLYETDGVARYVVWLKDSRDLAAKASWLRGRLAELSFDSQDPGYEVIEWRDRRLSPYYHGTMQFLFALTCFIGVVMAVVVTFSVLNSTTMTVLERSEEIGTYRALGLSRGLVRRLFVMESVWLCAFSLLFGVALARAVIWFVNSSKFIYHPPGVSGGMTLLLVPDPVITASIAVVLLLLTAFATWVSTLGRLRLEPAVLLGGVAR